MFPLSRSTPLSLVLCTSLKSSISWHNWAHISWNWNNHAPCIWTIDPNKPDMKDDSPIIITSIIRHMICTCLIRNVLQVKWTVYIQYAPHFNFMPYDTSSIYKQFPSFIEYKHWKKQYTMTSFQEKKKSSSLYFVVKERIHRYGFLILSNGDNIGNLNVINK